MDWRIKANCYGVADPELFWPVGWSSADRARIAEVVGDYCNPCPVRAECATLGEQMDATDGIWGGARRTRSGVEASARPVTCGSTTGYYRHHRLEEPVCGQCQAAYDTNLQRNRDRRRRQRATTATIEQTAAS